MKLFVSALEYSANIHLKYLLCEIIAYENVELCGIFDEDIIGEIDSESKDNCKHKIYGTALCNISKVGVMGFIDVLKRARFFLRLRAKCLNLALESDKVLLMDSSSFNIPLAKRIKKRDSGKMIMYYILPQVWAWKPWRAKAIEANCDKLAAILPFEVECYRQKARFVGHPLLDEIKHFRESMHLCESKVKSNGSQNIFTFMPGSRLSEINRIFPIFLQVKNELKSYDSTAQFNLVVPKKFKDKNLTEIYGTTNDFQITFDAHTSLLQSKFAFICSGTATLECALIGTPFVLGYQGRWIEAFVVKQFLNIRFVGLANLLYSHIKPNSQFHTELLQKNLTAKNLLISYHNANPSDFLEKSFALRVYLKSGSARVVAQWLLEK